MTQRNRGKKARLGALKHRALVVMIVTALTAGCAQDTADEENPPTHPRPEGHSEWTWPSLDEAALRPGDKLRPTEYDVDNTTIRGCTVAFVFASPDNSSLYISTASHCINGMSVGDVLRIGGLVDGTLVYCSRGAVENASRCADRPAEGPGVENDFALFRISDADRHKVHPALRHWGGPTGLLEGAGTSGARVLMFGNSYLRDGGKRDAPDGVDARDGVILRSTPWTTHVRLSVPAMHGDSGAPFVLDDGRALGLLRSLEVGTYAVTGLDAALTAARDLGAPEVVLMTWPRIDTGQVTTATSGL